MLKFNFKTISDKLMKKNWYLLNLENGTTKTVLIANKHKRLFKVAYSIEANDPIKSFTKIDDIDIKPDTYIECIAQSRINRQKEIAKPYGAKNASTEFTFRFRNHADVKFLHGLWIYQTHMIAKEIPHLKGKIRINTNGTGTLIAIKEHSTK